MSMNMNIDLKLGDCLQRLKELPDNSVDSIVTDPPYHLTSIVKRFGKEGSAPAQFGTDGVFKRSSKGFMGKEWDGGDIAFRTDVWKECLRILKPGGHLLAFSHSRTYHRMAVAVEDAGFEIRDQILWIYGSGFPKSHNIGKAVDKLLGNEREIIGPSKYNDRRPNPPQSELYKQGGHQEIVTKGQSEWEGWGTALKPAHEPIVMARKPLSEKSVAENVLKWGTGGINIDESRIGYKDDEKPHSIPTERDLNNATGWADRLKRTEDWEPNNTGRFPANIMFDEEAAEVLDEMVGEKNYNKGRTGEYKGGHRKQYVGTDENPIVNKIDGKFYSDKGGPSKFFYVPKANKKDRDEGTNELYLCENNLQWEIETLNQLLKGISVDTIKIPEDNEWNTILCGNNIMDEYHQGIKFITSTILRLIIELKTLNYSPHLNTKDYIVDVIKTMRENGLNLVNYVEHINLLKQNTTNEKMVFVLGVVSVVLPTLLEINKKGKTGNFHATVKPTDLMLYLIRMVTPKGGTTLDPFMGSGSTGKAAVRGGFSFIGIEKEEEYIKISEARINNEYKKQYG